MQDWQFLVPAINFGAIKLLLQKMEQFYGAIIWYHLMAPFYGMCVLGLTTNKRRDMKTR